VGDEPSGAADDALRDLALLTEAVREAGQKALGFHRAQVRHWTKEDGTPVSDADLAVDEALSRSLRTARPGYGWISEELGGAATSGRAFVVDPIDGTRAFLAGEDGWAVAVAVVDDGRPVAAVVFRPARMQLYAASLGGGAMLNGAALTIPAEVALAGARVAMPGQLWREAGFRAAGVKRGGWVSSLALRLCGIARGSADAVVTKPGPQHWDLAAADLVLHEAGGRLVTLSGLVPRYDVADTTHDPVFAGPAGLVDTLRGMAAGYHAGAA